MNETKKVELHRIGTFADGDTWCGVIESTLLYAARGKLTVDGYACDPEIPRPSTLDDWTNDGRIRLFVGVYGASLEEISTDREWYIHDSPGYGSPFRVVMPGTQVRVVLRGRSEAVRVFVDLEYVSQVIESEPCTKMVQIRAPESWIESVDRWRASQRIRMSRSEAIRHLTIHAIEIGTRV